MQKNFPTCAIVVSFFLVVLCQSASAQSPRAVPSPSAVGFGLQTLRVSGSQTITLTNTGATPLHIGNVVLTGDFYGDFVVVNNCGSPVPAGQSCVLNVSFIPLGTGVRKASLLVFDDAPDNPQSVLLSGIGKGSCINISDCAYPELNSRTSANRNGFFVYQDADSGFNHGFPSGFFGNIDLHTITVNAACVDDPKSSTGCNTGPPGSLIDGTRGTVFSLSFPSMSEEQFAGVNFQDPENFSLNGLVGNGYDLTSATDIQFEMRSPSGMNVQFGVGGCVTNFVPVNSGWMPVKIPLDSLFPPSGSAAVCPPDITATHILFSISTSGVASPAGGKILLDNIQFTPTPTRQPSSAEALSLPFSTQTFGVVPLLTVPPSSSLYPLDQANRNLAAIYEASLTVLSLLKRGQPADVANAMEIVQALDYALYHDNHGDQLPISTTNPSGCFDGVRASQCGLHSAYQSGDIALLNNQPPPEQGQAGDVRLAGFTGGCPGSGFCLVLDGATGGNNAWAMLALTAAYVQSGNTTYLADAETIGNWIIANLLDPNQFPASFGGYFLGYNDQQAPPKALILGKSTENNGDIFAAFSLLAQIEMARGNNAAAAQWTSAAKTAGDFVLRMFDSPNGRFYAGTVTQADAQNPGRGVCVSNLTAGNDVINSCDFLDSNSFTALPMAGSLAYQNSISWSAPLQFLLGCPVPTDVGECFTQTVTTAAGNTFQGFDIVPDTPSMGIAWEFTGQTAETCSYMDGVLNVITFAPCAQTYAQKILNAQNQAPFGDGMGIVASVLQGGDTLTVAKQCLDTPFQCIPERVGLAATNWGILADQAFNPLAFPGTNFAPASLHFSAQVVGTSSPSQTIKLTNIGMAPLFVSGVAISGVNSIDFQQQNNCSVNTPLISGAACTITVTFTPTFGGDRTAVLVVSDNSFGSSQTVALTGTGQPVDDFSISVTPASLSVVAGSSVTYQINSAVTVGNPQSIFLSVQGLSSCASPTFSPNPISSGQLSSLAINTTADCSPSSLPFVVTGAGAEVVHSASAALTIGSSAVFSPTALMFGNQTIGTHSASQTVIFTNRGVMPVTITEIALSGSFTGDFTQTNDCIPTVSPQTNCTIAVTFTPAGTGTRQAILYVFDATGSSPQSITLAGTGRASCKSISGCALQDLLSNVTANQNGFFVYKDADSAFNHGFPSGLFGGAAFAPTTIVINAACVDDPASPSGCSNDSARVDGTHGTVFSLTFPPMSGNQFGGLNFQDPEDFGQGGVIGSGYDLTPATGVQFDVRSPGGIQVQFGVGNCTTTRTLPASKSYTTITIPLTSLTSPGPNATCPPVPGALNILFIVGTSAAMAPNGGTVLLDNIRFVPTPNRAFSTMSLPASTEVLGVTAHQNFPIPADQAVRNPSTVYESSLTAISLLRNGEVDAARGIVRAMDYALYHDNHGDSVPISPANALGCYDGSPTMQCGLHSAYQAGDIALFNNQASPKTGHAGDVRLSGFSAGDDLCGKTGFCLVLDGAAGANNGWAILAFAAAYQQFGDATYLTDAETIGNWITSNLTDTSAVSFGGYFIGYTDGGSPKTLILGKSTADNAVIFAAFNALAQIEIASGNKSAAAQWQNAATVAGDFVMKMFDSTNGRFFAGTLNSSAVSSVGPRVCVDLSLAVGSDIVNSCDFLNSNSLSTLAMAASPHYAHQIDWQRPLQYVLACPLANSSGCFTQTVTVNGTTFQGFDLVPAPPATGSAWEYTGQTAETCNFLQGFLGGAIFQNCFQSYQAQLLQVQNLAPFGNGLGVAASTLPDGDILPPLNQCLNTPFVCISERVSLATSNFAIFADQNLNPLGPGFSLRAGIPNPSAVSSGGSSMATITLIPINGYSGTITLACSISPAVNGAGAPTCSFGNANPVSLTASIPVSTTITFTTVGQSGSLPSQFLTFNASTKLQFLLLAVVLPALISFVIGARVPQSGNRRELSVRHLALFGMIAVLGCGSGSTNPPPPQPLVKTPSGSYTIIITAKDSNGLIQNGLVATVIVNVN